MAAQLLSTYITSSNGLVIPVACQSSSNSTTDRSKTQYLRTAGCIILIKKLIFNSNFILFA
jgi:hypothetical protein